MKPIAITFEFLSYDFQPEKRWAVFRYAINFKNREPLEFSEKIIFKKSFNTKKIPAEILQKTLESVHLMLGISYYKLYCPKKIKLNIEISKEQADFWNEVYTKGLGEFFYCNKIDFRNLINFPYDKKIKAQSYQIKRKGRFLLGIGGGKDSIVAGEILKGMEVDFSGLVIETGERNMITENITKLLGTKSILIERRLDPEIFKEHEGAYNGHIPISAVFAFLGYLSAVVYDYSAFVVANEKSSDFGNIKYLGGEINHQWSKSSEFEELFQNYSRNFLSPDIRYFSILRPLYEIRIVQEFLRYKKYFLIFTSCNRNFRVEKERPESLWCAECPKCAFMFLLFSAFLGEKELVSIFGQNLFDKKELLETFRDILGIGKMKPFDCVGTFEEARAALFMAKDKFEDTFILKSVLPKIKFKEKEIEKVFKFNAANNLPEKFLLAVAEKILILGYGKEGKVTEKYLRGIFPAKEISIADENISKDYLENQGSYDLAIKTPGIKKELVMIPYTTATNIFFSQTKNLIIGVTGSKGKSTTASLIYEILKAAGKKVALLGNIGNPMLEMLLKKNDPKEIYVVELSSYQLDDIKYSPYIAVVTNLFPEHMNYHGSVEKYYVAKKNIIKYQDASDCFIYNGKNQEMKKWLKESRGINIPFNDININGIKIPLKGEHNAENVKAALKVAEILKIPKTISKKAIENFKALPHRLEFVGEYQGIKFYDDAISTAPESTIMAIRSIPNISTIFLGGEDRGYDFSSLEKEIRRNKIKNIVLFPESGRRIFKSKKGLNILETKDMEEAVKFAYQNTEKGKVCLLSTASPSYGVWKNFEEKGSEFQKLVKKFSKA